MRPLSLCALLLALPLAGQAAPAPTETVIRLRLQPRAAPKPALKYQLLPELYEMNPGNPIQGYMKCFMEQNHFFFDKKSEEDREKWQTMPLKELPLGELRNYGRTALRQADWAARLDTADWQTLLLFKRDGINLLLPEVQQMRRLTHALKVRFRVEIAEGRFEDAVGTAKTMFALARHLGEHPTLIGDLVGIAVALQAIGSLEEMIEQPGAPNLYWALTDLPQPFIDLRKGVQGERLFLAGEFAHFDERSPMTDAQLQHALERVRRLMKDIRVEDPRKWLNALANDVDYLQAARQRLIDHGLGEKAVQAFPPMQVVLLEEKRLGEVRRDEMMKAMGLPLWQAQAFFREARRARSDDRDHTLFLGLMPACDKAKMAEARLEQRLALLRCIEALRLYGAEHTGQLPARLEDVPLPLPVDPMTGKPFPYQRDGHTAILQGTPPAGQEGNAPYKVRYEVTINP